MSKTADSGSSLSEDVFADMINHVWEQAEVPIKVLTPKDFKRRSTGTFLGVPVVVDPLLPKDTVLVEYSHGYREELSSILRKTL